MGDHPSRLEPARASTTPRASSQQTSSVRPMRLHPLIELQRSIGNQATLRVLRSQNADHPLADSSIPMVVRDALRSPGRPLQSDLQGEMEVRFGHDFSRVRIHSDAGSAESARLVNTPAYTVGHHVVFGAGQFAPKTDGGFRLLAHELAHVVQQESGRTAESTNSHGIVVSDPADPFEREADSIAHRVALNGSRPFSLLVGEQKTDGPLTRPLIPRLGAAPRSAWSALRSEGFIGHARPTERVSLQAGQLLVQRGGTPGPAFPIPTTQTVGGPSPPWAPASEQETAYPMDVGYLVTSLLRHGYIEQIAKLIGPTWRSMSEEQLTAYLSKHYTEKQVEAMFLEASAGRTAIKTQFRRANVIGAFVIGLIWARDNIAEGEWGKAIVKVSETTVAAWMVNRLLYARDPAAAALMAKAPGRFGKWLQGAARGNRLVNFLARDVARGLLIWDLKDLLMSGGGGGPNIPFDIIYNVDIDDPSTWNEPSQTMLDLGFNIWYRQMPTPRRPQPNLYLGKVEGSMLKGLAKTAYAVGKAAIPFNREMMERMEREGARREFEKFQEQNPDATPADYDRFQKALDDFDTWYGRE
jgi:hypothetical protein